MVACVHHSSTPIVFLLPYRPVATFPLCLPFLCPSVPLFPLFLCFPPFLFSYPPFPCAHRSSVPHYRSFLMQCPLFPLWSPFLNSSVPTAPLCLCSSVPTVPLCLLFLCYSLPTVPYCPLFPLRSPFLYTSVPTVPPDLFLCAHASSVLTVPLFPFAHCSSVLTVPLFLSAICPSVLTIPQCPIFLCVHRSSIPLCPSAKATSTGIGVEWARGSQKQSNDNSKVNRTQVIRFQISTSAESNLCSVTTVVETEDQIRRMLLRIKNFFYYCIRYYSSTRNVSIFFNTGTWEIY